jgi:ABC-type transport system substrate-binding protein
VLNYGRYSNRVFDSLLAGAAREPDPALARKRWREAMDTLNADAPAIFLYAPANAAVVHRRLEAVELDPYSWLSGLSHWKIGAEPAVASR